MDQQKIGRFIRDLRKEKDLTQEQLDGERKNEKTDGNLEETVLNSWRILSGNNLRDDDSGCDNDQQVCIKIQGMQDEASAQAAK